MGSTCYTPRMMQLRVFLTVLATNYDKSYIAVRKSSLRKPVTGKLILKHFISYPLAYLNVYMEIMLVCVSPVSTCIRSASSDVSSDSELHILAKARPTLIRPTTHYTMDNEQQIGDW